MYIQLRVSLCFLISSIFIFICLPLVGMLVSEPKILAYSGARLTDRAQYPSFRIVSNLVNKHSKRVSICIL